MQRHNKQQGNMETNEFKELKKLLERIENRLNLGAKKMLTVNEAAAMLQISPDRVYHYVSAREIPHYRNKCRRIWFDKEELEQWMRAERVTPDYELMDKAAEYTAGKNNKKR